MVFTTYVSSQLDTANRVDVICDVYNPDSLKSRARKKRGKGVRRQVLAITVILQNWKDFLYVDDDKTELSCFWHNK